VRCSKTEETLSKHTLLNYNLRKADMSHGEPTQETLAQIFTQRRQAVNNLVEQLKGLVGKEASNEVIISLCMTLAGELSNFYRFFELESRMINALQKEIEVLAIAIYQAESKDEVRRVIDTISKDLSGVLRSSSMEETIS
jgi:hypothetical protein